MKEFAIKAFRKFIENLLSIKVWVIFTYIFSSLYLVVNSHMTGETFATSTGAVISVVLAIREGIKVRRISAASNGATKEQIKEIEKISI
jgi:hypothetical protein